MTSLQVKYFLTLVEEQSFSKAAARLFVTQPSFSQFISKLEKETGHQLFDRSCNPIKLTGAGQAFYHAAIQITSIENDLENELNDLSHLQRGKLVLGTTPFRASTLLSKSIAYFHKNYDKIEISIVEGSYQQLAKGISKGEIDLGICSGELDLSIFYSEVLAEEKLYLAVGNEENIHPSLIDARLTADDIKHNALKVLKAPRCEMSQFDDIPFIQLTHEDNLSFLSQKIMEEHHVTPTYVLNAQNLYTAISFVIEGLGTCFIPDTLIKFGNLNKHPYYFNIRSDYTTNQICLITKKNRYLSKAALEYIMILKQLIKSGTWRL